MSLVRHKWIERGKKGLREWWEAPPEGTRARVKWELDREVSKKVRARDKKCVTCGTRRNLTCSHYFKRGFMNTRFDLRNCNAQCARCNKLHNRVPWPYRNYMEKKYGQAVIDELFALRNSRAKVETWQMAELLEELIERRAA